MEPQCFDFSKVPFALKIPLPTRSLKFALISFFDFTFDCLIKPVAIKTIICLPCILDGTGVKKAMEKEFKQFAEKQETCIL